MKSQSGSGFARENTAVKLCPSPHCALLAPCWHPVGDPARARLEPGGARQDGYCVGGVQVLPEAPVEPEARGKTRPFGGRIAPLPRECELLPRGGGTCSPRKGLPLPAVRKPRILPNYQQHKCMTPSCQWQAERGLCPEKNKLTVVLALRTPAIGGEHLDRVRSQARDGLAAGVTVAPAPSLLDGYLPPCAAFLVPSDPLFRKGMDSRCHWSCWRWGQPLCLRPA